MSHPIHVNLLLRTERRNPAPVRARIMIPVSAALFAAAFTVVGLLIHGALDVAESNARRATIERDLLRPKYQAFIALRAELEAARTGIRQLDSYRTARPEWSPLLLGLPNHVPATVQLTELVIQYPQRETNRVEAGSFRLSGVTTDRDAARTLVEALAAPPFADRFVNAEIRRFGVEPRRADQPAERYLFEIEGECCARRFE